MHSSTTKHRKWSAIKDTHWTNSGIYSFFNFWKNVYGLWLTSSGILCIVNLRQFNISVTKLLYKSIKNSIKNQWLRFLQMYMWQIQKCSHLKRKESCVYTLYVRWKLHILYNHLPVHHCILYQYTLLGLRIFIAFVLVTKKVNTISTWIYYWYRNKVMVLKSGHVLG